ncbi:AAA family ATPase [Staphylococcus simulans]|uniref:AAA family ATPase n=1 Tax=Staphylococcus simulans TaxID=1286 RepID=UPI001E3B94DF|nr:AAA family ATPase [Staphylococcus simulans]MCD8916247.1 AAA family ATPase [Staphylococcus simulans]
MKIISLKMENFRQFYGTQVIDFATDSEKNTTILFGENGKGKTGIYRALMFALFGSRTISQDAKGERIHLTNFKLLDEARSGQSSVSLKFEHENKIYEIRRSVNAAKLSETLIDERMDDQYIIEIDSETGNTLPRKIEDENQIKLFINKIINEEIKDFFLFDAEKIDTLAKADSEVRKEVKNAIFSLLQIDKLDKAKDIITRYTKDIKHKLIHSTKNGTVEEISKQIETLEKNINEKEEKTTLLRDEINKIEENIGKHQLTLEKNRDIVLKKDQLRDRERNLENLGFQLEELKSSISASLIQDAPYLITNSVLLNNKEFFKDFLGDNKLNIPLDLIKQSLEKGHCLLCDNNLEEHNKNKKYVEMLLETQNNSETYDMARVLLRLTEEKTSTFESDNNRLDNLMRKYDITIKKIDEEKEKIESISNDIAEQARNNVNLADIQHMIDVDNSKRDEYVGQLKLVSIDLNNYNNEKDKLEEEFQKVVKIESENEHENQKSALLSSLEKEIKEIKQEFSDEVRKLLGDYTTQMFKNLIDEKDLEVIREVNINPNFEIVAHNQNKYVITQDISQGQRQILALSFITSLAKLAVRENSGEQIDYPLFMDSPFNRLSAKNRDNLIERIPNLTAQWILLVTDTELTISEEKIFKETGSLGKWYRINQVAPHYSQIEEVPLSERMATRGGI